MKFKVPCLDRHRVKVPKNVFPRKQHNDASSSDGLTKEGLLQKK